MFAYCSRSVLTSKWQGELHFSPAIFAVSFEVAAVASPPCGTFAGTSSSLFIYNAIEVPFAAKGCLRLSVCF